LCPISQHRDPASLNEGPSIPLLDCRHRYALCQRSQKSRVWPLESMYLPRSSSYASGTRRAPHRTPQVVTLPCVMTSPHVCSSDLSQALDVHTPRTYLFLCAERYAHALRKGLGLCGTAQGTLHCTSRNLWPGVAPLPPTEAKSLARSRGVLTQEKRQRSWCVKQVILLVGVAAGSMTYAMHLRCVPSKPRVML